jgi:hypothetical protein
METMHLHRLLVMDDKEICGIVTQTDILRAIHGVFAAFESQRRALVTQVTNLLQAVVQDAGKLQRFLQSLPDPPQALGEPAGASGGLSREQESALAPGPDIF